MGAKSNRQGEVQLLAEWLTTRMAGVPSKTHVFVGDQTLIFQGMPISPARQAAFKAWSDWCDARLVFAGEVWIVEAKIVGLAGAYGQVLDYCDQYPQSDDYQAFRGWPVVPVVLCAFEKPRTARYFERFGVRTIVFTPAWSEKSLENKIYGSAVDL